MDSLIKTTFYSTQKENRTRDKTIAYCREIEQLCGFQIFQFNYDTNVCIIYKTLCTILVNLENAVQLDFMNNKMPVDNNL